MNATSDSEDFKEWGHPTNVSKEMLDVWAKMTTKWKLFTGEIQEPSLDIGGARKKGLTVTTDPFPRGPVDVRCVGEALPFRDRIFVSVLLESVMKHVMNPDQVLSEAVRVIKGSGRLYVSSPVNYVDHHRHSYTSRNLVQLIEAAGFTIIRKMGLGLSNSRISGVFRKLGIHLLLYRFPTCFCRVLYIVAEKTSSV